MRYIILLTKKMKSDDLILTALFNQKPEKPSKIYLKKKELKGESL